MYHLGQLLYAGNIRVPLFVVAVSWGILPLRNDWSLSCDHGLGYVIHSENDNNNIPGATSRRQELGLWPLVNQECTHSQPPARGHQHGKRVSSLHVACTYP